MQRWFAQEGDVQELNLEYIGEQQVDLKNSIFKDDYNYYQQYTNAWQIFGYDQYVMFKNEFDLDIPSIGICCFIFGDSYVISYGREIKRAYYDFSEYNKGFNTTSDYASVGYYVHYIYDETEYYVDTVFIYKCDKIKIGNSWYLY